MLVDSTEAAAEDDRVRTICARTWSEQFATIEMSQEQLDFLVGAQRWALALCPVE